MTKIGSNSEMNQNPIMVQNQNWNEINNNGFKSRFWRRWKFHSYFSFAFSQQNWWCKEVARSSGKCSPEAKLTLWRLSIYHDFKTRVLHHDSSKNCCCQQWVETKNSATRIFENYENVSFEVFGGKIQKSE